MWTYTLKTCWILLCQRALKQCVKLVFQPPLVYPAPGLTRPNLALHTLHAYTHTCITAAPSHQTNPLPLSP